MSETLISPPISTDEMVAVHTYFRREFRLAGGVVRHVTDGDVRRAGVVATHLDLIGRALHHHHTAEDELMWPTLLQRVPEELAPIVHLMESQHERVDTLLQEIGLLLPSWTQRADSATGARLAALYDELYAGLAEHLDAEEQRLLPIAARTLSQEEWNEGGERARSGTPPRERALTFGMIAYEGDPEVVAEMLADAPPPVRWLVPRLARRAFRKHALAIHGTVTP